MDANTQQDLKNMASDAKQNAENTFNEAKEKTQQLLNSDQVKDAKEKLGELKEDTETMLAKWKQAFKELPIEKKIYTFYFILVIVCSLIGLILTSFNILSTNSVGGLILGFLFGIIISVYLWFMVGKDLVEKDNKSKI